MPRLSCVIPVNGSVHAFEATLVSVLANRPEDCEILVALSTPYDDPYDVKDEVVFVEAPPRASYVECANLGIQASRGMIVHVLAAGMEVSEGWADIALARFVDPSVAAVSPVIRSSDSGQVVAAGLNYGRGGRRIVCRDAAAESGPNAPLGPLADAAFYRKSALEAVGGLPASLIDELADVDLALALRFAGFRAELEPRSTIVRPHASGAALQSKRDRGFRYGLAAERLFWRNQLGSSGWSTLAAHAWTVAGQLLSNPWPTAMLGQALGRLAALRKLGECEQRRKLLQNIRELQNPQLAPGALRTAASSRSDELRVDSAHSPLRPTVNQDIRVSRP